MLDIAHYMHTHELYHDFACGYDNDYNDHACEVPVVEPAEFAKYGITARRVELTNYTIGLSSNIQDGNGDGMTILPIGLRDISNEVKELILQGATLSPLPDWFGEFTCLENLDISGYIDGIWDNQMCEEFTHLPPCMPVTLRTLSLKNLGLEELPESIGQLSNLTKLHINTCQQITELPDSVWNILSLTD